MASIDSRLEPFKKKMECSFTNFQNELAGISAGRASTGLLEPIKVDAYGSTMPITQVGTISVSDARTLTVTVWDKGLVKAVEKAIRDSDIGANPMVDGTIVRIPIPQPTAERRVKLAKLAAKYEEETKISIRNIRRDAMDFVKELEKASEISEDVMHRLTDEIQKLTNDYVNKVSNASTEKQKEINSI